MIDTKVRRATAWVQLALCLAVVLSSGCGASAARTVAKSEPRSSGAADEEAAPADVGNKATALTTRDAIVESVKTAAVEGAGGGVKLSGRILYRGAPPARRAINMSKDAKCIELHGGKSVFDEDLIVSAKGGVKNAFVRVHHGAPKRDYPMPEKPAVLDQEGCMFRPRVQGIRAGQKLLVGNADPVTHNVRSFPVLNAAFNFGQPPKTEPRVRVFERAEREIEIQCDFHLWMHAYVFVMDHPFYCVSDDSGTFAIEGLPTGEYTLESWHEKLGKKRKTVKVADADVVDVDFTYPN